MELGRDVQIRMAAQLSEQSSRESLPSLLIQVPSQTIAGFDCVGRDNAAAPLDTVICIPAPATPPPAAPVPAYDDAQVPYALSLSMPASPSGFHLSQFRTASVRRDEAPAVTKPAGQQAEVHSPRLLKQTRFHSQPILHASQQLNEGPRRADTTRDKRFDPFKTFSGRLERQLSNLRGHPMDLDSPGSKISEETDQVPGTDRYFDALEGPELDTLRSTEVAVLPSDEKSLHHLIELGALLLVALVKVRLIVVN